MVNDEGVYFQEFSFSTIRPCPHDTLVNCLRTIASGSRHIACVHMGETGIQMHIAFIYNLNGQVCMCMPA